jgi:hypothetical protein
MALGVPGFVRIGAAIAGCALVAACTPDPGPTTTPTPVPPTTASPTPSTTRTETEIERQQRLDFEAAEKAYRASIAEQQRLAELGNAKSTPALRETAEGKYLQFALQNLKDVEKSGWRAVGALKIIGVTPGGWKPSRLYLFSCEDGSAIRFVNASGRNVTPANLERRFVQKLTIVKIGASWKVSDLESKKVESFSEVPCAT